MALCRYFGAGLGLGSAGFRVLRLGFMVDSCFKGQVCLILFCLNRLNRVVWYILQQLYLHRRYRASVRGFIGFRPSASVVYASSSGYNRVFFRVR